MASILSQLAFTHFIYPLVVFIFCVDSFAQVSSSFHASDNGRRSMILPLYLSTPKLSNHPNQSGFDGRRRLHKLDTSSARMRLYDDLLSNGYYTTRLGIGTPPQEFALIVDTGSTVTYVPCSDCEHCGKHQDPKFQLTTSSTYQPVKCSSNCNCDDERVQCTYERRYAEMSSSSGILGDDFISFGNESHLAPQRAVFGCENIETGDLYSQRADGIMGLGRGQLSVMDQLVNKGVISDSFSLCYGGMGVGGGAMILGGISSPHDMVFTHSDPLRSPYYNIALKGMEVAGKPLKLNSMVFDRKHGTVLDSGTTYAYLPEEAFNVFKDAIINEISFLKRINGPDPNYKDICFSGAGSVSQLSDVFPEINMVFSNGKKFSLSPENYLFRHTKVSGAYCLGIFKNADSTTLLGGIFVRNTLVTYDRENHKIGFLKTNCSELWRRVDHTSAPPSPLISSSNSTTKDIPISPTSDRLPETLFPGTFHIGIITFDMVLGINNSMKPNLTELAEFIAYEVGVKVSQVHLMNYTHKGNDSLVRWAICPAESANYFSNTSAMNIILHLREHHMQLPAKFGSYQLVELKLEPKLKSSKEWGQHHLLVVAVGITLVLGISTLGVWLVWRLRRQGGGSYEPVMAVVPDQELQPL